MPLGPKPNAPFAIQGRYLGTTQGQNWAAVFHLQYQGGTPMATDMNALALGLRNAWNTNIAPIVNTSTILSSCDTIDLASRTGAVGSNSTSSTGTGTSTNLVPVNMACCVSFKAPIRFRGGHARMYLPLRDATAMAGGRLLSGTYQTAVSTGMTNWLTAVNAITSGTLSFFLILLQQYSHDANHNPIYLPGGPQKYPITSIQVHQRADSMRRRLGKEI